MNRVLLVILFIVFLVLPFTGLISGWDQMNAIDLILIALILYFTTVAVFRFLKGDPAYRSWGAFAAILLLLFFVTTPIDHIIHVLVHASGSMIIYWLVTTGIAFIREGHACFR